MTSSGSNWIWGFRHSAGDACGGIWGRSLSSQCGGPADKLKISPTFVHAADRPLHHSAYPRRSHIALSHLSIRNYLRMGPPRRKVLATAQETLTPPDELPSSQLMARAIKATGNNIYLVEYSDKTQALVELPSRFRSTIWIKRGSYVVVDTKVSDERDNKIGGEIVNIVRDEKAWRKAPFWYDSCIYSSTQDSSMITELIDILSTTGQKNSSNSQWPPPTPMMKRNRELARCLHRTSLTLENIFETQFSTRSLGHSLSARFLTATSPVTLAI